MPDRTRFRRGVAALAALALSVVPLAASGQAQARGITMAAVYDIYVGGIRIARASTNAEVTESRFDAHLALQLEGIAAAFSPGWLYQAASMGRVDGDRVIVDRADATKRIDGETNRTSVLFHGGGEVEIRYDPPRPNRPANPDIPRERLVGAFDILSGVTALLWRYNRDGSCDGSFPVLDGRKLFVATTEPGPATTLNKPDIGMYGGPATRCDLTLTPAAGRFSNAIDPQSGKAEDFFQSSSGGANPEAREVDVWYAAPEAGGPVVPVRIESDSPWGRIVVHLVGFDTGA
jgi:hypothetical protein